MQAAENDKDLSDCIAAYDKGKMQPALSWENICKRTPTNDIVSLPALVAPAFGVTMPTLFRLLVIVGIMAGLGYAGLFALATFLTPEMREITVAIPADRLQR